MIKLSKPFKGASALSITQGYSESHKANDFQGKFGEFIVSPFNAKVASIIGIESDMDEPDAGSLSNGYGIRLISTEDPTLSCTYWHCQSVFPYKKGDIVLQGQVVSMMGNSGFVKSNGVYVEVDRRLIPPYPGTHVHWSMGQMIGQNYVPLDPSKLISWDIPVCPNLMETLNLFFLSISNFLKKGRLEI